MSGVYVLSHKSHFKYDQILRKKLLRHISIYGVK